MNRRTRILAATLRLALAWGLTACGPDSDEAAAPHVREAASYLALAEEEGGLGEDAVVDADTPRLEAMVEEELEDGRTEPTDTGDVCDFEAHRARVVARHDENADGVLGRRELRALRVDLGERRDSLDSRRVHEGRRVRPQAFWRVRWVFDQDADGALSPEERAALGDAMEARCQRLRAQRLEQYDTNGDGVLDEAERRAVRETRRARWELLRRERLETYDVNRDGVLDASERATLRKARVEAAWKRRAEVLTTYDTDADGVLSTAEALPLREALQQRITEGHDAER
ncbi:calcium-binding protein [Myxococcus sp. MISCRS1]|uniref:calcium-binding protein n=1 Tax=Myxococcus sp. MISCRS1 TaxID=2996786 RepID=UPI00226F9432|nr:calcium-binding protein [Myxococcus sp. MISCRS1]MCY1000557.1 calcium-binding protein [Myxococcus sp. MISCRS1]